MNQHLNDLPPVQRAVAAINPNREDLVRLCRGDFSLAEIETISLCGPINIPFLSDIQRECVSELAVQIITKKEIQ